MMVKETEWGRIEQKKRIKELESAIRKLFAAARKWQPAPCDPGIKPGGIRDRAIKGIRK
jgi:hypothetical protein